MHKTPKSEQPIPGKARPAPIELNDDELEPIAAGLKPVGGAGAADPVCLSHP